MRAWLLMGLLVLAGCQLVSGLSDYEATETGVGGSGASSSSSTSAAGAGGAGGSPIPENQWARTFGSQDADVGTAIALGPEGEVFCGGGFQGANFDAFTFGPYGLDDAYVVELDRDGAAVWAIAMGGSGSDRVLDVAVEESTGRLAVVGLFERELIFSDEGTPNLIGSMFGASVFVVVFDAERNVEWTRVIEGNAFVRSPDDDMGSGVNRIAFAPGGGVVVTGGLYGTMSFVPDGPTLTSTADTDFWILSLTSEGGYAWHNTVRGTGGSIAAADDDGPPGLGIADNGDVFVGGSFSGSLTVEGQPPLVAEDSLDAYFLRFTSDGVSEVREAIGGAGVQILTALSIQPDGTALMGGAFIADSELRADIFLRRLSRDGVELDSIAFEGTPDPVIQTVRFSTLSTVDVDSNGDVVAAGAVYRQLVVGDTTLQNSGHYDIFVVRLDNQLDPITVQQFGGPDDDIVVDAALDDAGRIVLTGAYAGQLNMLGSSLTSVGSLDILVAKLFVDDN